MIEYSRYALANGLRVLLHRDETTPLVTVNLLWCVGARDEKPNRTGFAHLFEHLMFGGTCRFPDYDSIVDALGGENNAFTNNDYTNYYLTVPAQNLRQALILEADRMRGEWDIQGNQWHVLDVQRRVVTEEYHQRYINQPYGDVWMLLRPLCYQSHPYRWCTIGADIKHVQEASLDDVRQFFNRFYRPDNAILSIAGNINLQETIQLVEEIFSPIALPDSSPLPTPKNRVYPSEQPQLQSRRQEVKRNVPNNAIYKAWIMSDRWTPSFYAYDMLSDILSNGHSSRLYRRLVQDEGLFTEINAYITGDLGPGLFVISGKLCDNISPQQAESIIEKELARLQQTSPDDTSLHKEMEKVSNKYENNFLLSQYKACDRAHSLCYYEMIGMPNLINDEPCIYRQTTASQLLETATTLSPDRCSTLLINKEE